MKKVIKKSLFTLALFSMMSTQTYASNTGNIQSLNFGVNNLHSAMDNAIFSLNKKNEIKQAEVKETNLLLKDDKTENIEADKHDNLINTIAFANVQNFVYVRSNPSTDSDYVGKMYPESTCEIIGADGEWYNIKSGSIDNGWVKSDYLHVGKEAEEIAKTTGIKHAKVITTTLRVRSDQSIESEVLGLVPMDEDLFVIEESEEWVKISIEEGDGWVSKEYVDISVEYKYAESKEEEQNRLEREEAIRREKEQKEAERLAAERAEAERKESENKKTEQKQEQTNESTQNNQPAPSNSSKGQAVVNYASQFIGNPYVYGGSSLTNGADCSGFIMSVYANFGISLPHSSTALRNVGYGVSLSEAKPGDIICYSGHAAIYCENNTVIHASSAKTGIKYTSPADYRSVVCVRRIF